MKLSALIILCAALTFTPLVCRADQTPKWEYKVIAYKSTLQEVAENAGLDQKKLEDGVTLKLEEILNKLGTEGWELCFGSDGAFVVKRQKVN